MSPIRHALGFAIAFNLTSPIERILAAFNRDVVEEFDLVFTGWDARTTLRDKTKEFHVLAGVLERMLDCTTLTESQFNRARGWIDTQTKHVGPYGWSSLVSIEELEKERSRNPEFPASLINARVPASISGAG